MRLVKLFNFEYVSSLSKRKIEKKPEGLSRRTNTFLLRCSFVRSHARSLARNQSARSPVRPFIRSETRNIYSPHNSMVDMFSAKSDNDILKPNRT